jgi:NAD(P)-dependent dehydrogenase (short-subunit alcohol dehydrogenase family)
MAGIMDRFKLDNKVAVVTGASSGLGVGFAVALAEAGADIVLAARRPDRLAQTAAKVESTGRRALCVETDVTQPAHADRLIAATLEHFERIDILVNNAGLASAVPAVRETPEEFSRVLEVNIEGTYWVSQAAGRVMKPGSTIVNIASVLGITTGLMPQAAYSASKAGIIGLTRDLAQQWTGRRGIRVNALAPGFFETEMTDQFPDGFFERIRPRILAGRPGIPEELAATLLWLVSDASGYVTGQTLAVDGGFTIA